MTTPDYIPLLEATTIVMGQSPPGSTYNELGEGLPFFQGKAEFGEIHPTVKKWCSAPQRIAQPGDILMSVRAPVGPTNIADKQCCIGRGLAAIRAKTSHLYAGYLRFFLIHAEPLLASMGQGSTFAAIGRAEIASLQIPLPSLDEQRRIVDLLSRAEGIVRLRREAQKKAAEVIPALFLDMFGDPAANPKGWPMMTLGEVIRRADYGSSTKASEDATGLPMLRMGNVDSSGHLDLTTLKYVALSPKDVARFRLEEGDLLFNRTNSKELVGKTGLWDSPALAIAASYFIRIRVREDIVRPFFLWAFMNTPFMKRVLFDTARGAIGQANINAQELRGFHVAVPDMPTQEAFEARSRDMLAICAQQKVAADKSESTFGALLAGTFTTETSPDPFNHEAI